MTKLTASDEIKYLENRLDTRTR